MQPTFAEQEIVIMEPNVHYVYVVHFEIVNVIICYANQFFLQT